MTYKIFIKSKKVFEKDISHIPRKDVKVIFQKIHLLQEQWTSITQIKRLKKYSLCDYRLRVWSYRVLLSVHKQKKQVVIFRVLHRSKLY